MYGVLIPVVVGYVLGNPELRGKADKAIRNIFNNGMNVLKKGANENASNTVTIDSSSSNQTGSTHSSPLQ